MSGSETAQTDTTEETTDELPVERAVKFVAPDTIEGLAIPFGLDVDGEQFTPDTDFCFDWYGKSGRPFLYDHGLDREHQAVKLGTQTDYEERAEGVWAQVQLARNARYRKAVDKLIDEGALGFSSGAYPHLATINKTTKAIKRWPWVELSATPIPAHPGALSVHFVKHADFMARLEEDEGEVPGPVKAALAALDEWATNNSDDDSLPDGLKFADLIDRLSVDGPAWVKARRDWNVKSGRVLSAATRERLTAHPNALRQLADDLDELLTSADAPSATKAALLSAVLEAHASLARRAIH